MKTTVYLIVVIGVIGCAVAELSDLLNLDEREKAEHRKLLNICYLQTGISAQDLSDFQSNKKVPTAENLGCLIACYGQALKVLSPDGVYDITSVRHAVSPGNYKIAEKCIKDAPLGDLCLEAFTVYTCYLGSAKMDEAFQLFPL